MIKKVLRSWMIDTSGKSIGGNLYIRDHHARRQGSNGFAFEEIFDSGFINNYKKVKGQDR